MRTRSVTIAGIITITRVDWWWCYCLGRRRRRLGICRDVVGGGACRSSMTWIVGRSIPEWQCCGGDWLYRTSRFVPFVMILIVVVVVVVTHSSTMILCRTSCRDWNNVRHKEV